MGRYFGTDGFRGEAGTALTADHAYQIGRFIGWYYTEKKRREGSSDPARIVIGKDTRRSSYMLEYSLVGGITSSGGEAYLLHVTTTPSVSYITRVDRFDCGVMITASHNPFHDNGIKLVNHLGEKMEDEVICLIEDWLDRRLHVFDADWDTLPFAKGDGIGTTIDYIAGRNRYIGYLISLGVYDFRGIKVGLDCANGGAWSIAKAVFNALGADTYVIGDKPNGLNINRNVGSTHIEALQNFVLENRLDVGFAYDGDADRCLAVDEKGNVVTGDHILYMYSQYMKERGKLIGNTVVATAQSNFGLFQSLKEAGIDTVKTDVGDKYVYEAMKANGYRIGGEQTGHIIFSKYATTGDGILTSLKVMQVMLAKKKKLSELAETMKVYPQVQESVRVSDRKKVMENEDLIKLLEEIQGELSGNGSLLVRPSGTEPVIRVGVEAATEELAGAYKARIAEAVRKIDAES
ncbi:MAG: phosphoglucosamine mutase [Lachnospiraceae bacterium]|nr:phosphoglucosamine mutase [Lachnospiraceae bacterium]